MKRSKALLELVRKKIAISAAAGALVKYKDTQLQVINRVQDSYIYFLSNVRQFYIKGGAGTGKTWIAMKLALQEATDTKKKDSSLPASVAAIISVTSLLLSTFLPSIFLFGSFTLLIFFSSLTLVFQ